MFKAERGAIWVLKSKFMGFGGVLIRIICYYVLLGGGIELGQNRSRGYMSVFWFSG